MLSPNTEIVLAPETINALALQIDIMLRKKALTSVRKGLPCPEDQWMRRGEAAAYLGLPMRTFTRMRQKFPDALRPVIPHPLRFSQQTLDVFKATQRAVGAVTRRGRRPNSALRAS